MSKRLQNNESSLARNSIGGLLLTKPFGVAGGASKSEWSLHHA